MGSPKVVTLQLNKLRRHNKSATDYQMSIPLLVVTTRYQSQQRNGSIIIIVSINQSIIFVSINQSIIFVSINQSIIILSINQYIIIVSINQYIIIVSINTTVINRGEDSCLYEKVYLVCFTTSSLLVQ